MRIALLVRRRFIIIDSFAAALPATLSLSPYQLDVVKRRGH